MKKKIKETKLKQRNSIEKSIEYDDQSGGQLSCSVSNVSDDSVHPELEMKRKVEEQTYEEFLNSMMDTDDCNDDDEDEEEYRPDEIKDDDKEEQYCASKERVTKKELQELFNGCFETIVGELPQFPINEDENIE